MDEPTNKEKKQKSPIRGDVVGHSINAAIVAAIFSGLISILMLFNYIQLSTNNPIESITLKALVERLNTDPNNEQLLQEIRAFDLMARKAYFTSKWQIETGGILLLLGVIVVVVSLRYYFSATSKIEEPKNPKVSVNVARMISSKWILGIGSLLIILAIGASFLSVNHLDNYNPLVSIEEEKIEEEKIEMVDLSSPSITDSTIISKSIIEKADTLASAIEKTKSTSYTAPSLTEIKKQSNTFRGPLGNGVSYSKNIPSSWNVETGTNIKWKVKIPKQGFSSPVIWGDNLFLTGADASERWLYCYNIKNGELQWQHQAINIPGSPLTPPKTTDDTGLAAPSATTDGNVVVAIFGTGDIIACDNSGKRIWGKNLGIPANHYGHSSSLSYWEGRVIVQYDSNKGGRLLALDIATGEIAWDTKRASNISWASPILAEIAGKMQVITSSEPSVAGYDAETGTEIWKNDCMMGEVGPSPSFGNGLVFAGNEYATLAAIDPTKGTIVWQNIDYLPEVASPVVAEGLIFVATSYGIVVCYDAQTGTMKWENDFGEGSYSSPLVADGKLFVTDMMGVVHIMKVSGHYEKLGDFPTGEKVMSTLSFSDGCIYIRGIENLYCIGK